MQTLPSKRIGLWGLPGVGKTSFLITLRRPGMSRYWDFSPLDPRTMDFDAVQGSRLDMGQFPRPTEGEYSQYKYEITPRRTNERGKIRLQVQPTVQLDVIDPPGAFVISQDENYYAKILGYDGLLILISAVPDNTVHGSHINEVEPLRMLLNRLHQQRRGRDSKLGVFLAFCLTKCDLDAAHDAQINPEGFLADRLGPDAFKRILNYTSPERRAVFATSIVGRCQTPDGSSRPNVVRFPSGEVGIAHMEQLQPFGVAEPIEWLLRNVKAAYRTEAQNETARAR